MEQKPNDYVLCLTENGDIGLFKDGSDNCLGHGNSVSECIRVARYMEKNR